MFAIRPFWRWQTQGTYSLGFNAIMNWNDLDAGKAQEKPPTTAGNSNKGNHEDTKDTETARRMLNLNAFQSGFIAFPSSASRLRGCI